MASVCPRDQVSSVKIIALNLYSNFRCLGSTDTSPLLPPTGVMHVIFHSCEDRVSKGIKRVSPCAHVAVFSRRVRLSVWRFASIKDRSRVITLLIVLTVR